MTEEPANRGSLSSHQPEDAGTGEPYPMAPPQIRNDLWRVYKAFDYGPEKNLEVWQRAEVLLKGFLDMAEALNFEPGEPNDALLVALPDCRERIREEIRRAKSELEMRREWVQSLLTPWTKACEPIGSPELTRVMEKALGEVKDTVEHAREAWEKAKARLGEEAEDA